MYDPPSRDSFHTELQNPRLIPAPAGSVSPCAPLEQLRSTATQQINTHTNNNGLCRSCHCPFPCTHAQLAEATLDWL